MPDKGTTEGLSQAESKLDAATEARMSKIAASVHAARDAVKAHPENDKPPLLAARGELMLAASLAGEAKSEDEQAAQARVAAVMANDPKSKSLYLAEKDKMDKLQKEVQDLDSKYESEKKKKQAEYEAKLAEREQMLADERKREAQEHLDRIADRFAIGGGALVVLGVVLIITAPMAVLKQLGGAFAVLGGLAAGFPFVANEEWFKRSIGWTIGIIIILLLAWVIYSVIKKKQVTQTNGNSPN